MSAQVTGRYFGCPLPLGGEPVMLVKESAVLACGCACHVGMRIDNHEAATAAAACSAEHSQLIAHFYLLLRESLTEPRPVPLIDVARELLDEAQEHWQ